MKASKLKARLSKSRPMTVVTLRMPEDVIADLKRIAPHRGFSGYQPLIRAYVGQGLRDDLPLLESKPEVDKLLESLRKQGVKESLLEKALLEAGVVTT